MGQFGLMKVAEKMLLTSGSAHTILQKDLVTRLLDLTGATVLGIACLPVFLICAALVRIGSGGPVLFSQKRLGKDGVPFTLYKFRTMQPDAESYLRSNRELYARYVTNDYKLADEEDPRLTNVGRHLRRLGLDELPQLWNVLRGEMSLVGPRPIVPPEIDRYGDHATLLLSVKPGLTGPWQVANFPIRYPDRAKLDAEYVRHRSMRVNLGILLRTVPALLRRQIKD